MPTYPEDHIYQCETRGKYDARLPVSEDTFRLASPEQRKNLVIEGDNLPPPPTKGKGIKPQARNKWHVAPKEERNYNGKVYASKKEARYAQELDLRVRAGELSFYLEQVPFLITTGKGAIIHRIDFVTFTGRGDEGKSPRYNVEFIEVKGYDTPLGKLKRKLVEEKYSITIEVT